MSSKANKKNILKLIKSKMLIERLDAIHELKELGDTANFAVSALIRLVKKDEDDLARINALDVLAGLSEISQEVIAVIEASLNSNSIGVQKKAEKILSKMDRDVTIIPLPDEEQPSTTEETVVEAEDSPAQEGFFEPVKEEQLHQQAAVSSNDTEVTLAWEFEEFGVGETSELSSTITPDVTADQTPQQVEPEEVISEETPPPIEDLQPPAEEESIEAVEEVVLEEESIEAVEEVVLEEETKEPRNLEEELVLKELGDTPFTVSLLNLTTLFEELEKLDEDDARNRNYVHLKVNELMDKLMEHLYKLIGITAEEEWQKFISYKFNTGDQENLRNIISLLSSKIKENICDFCILSYLIFMGSLSQKLGMIDETIIFYEFILNQDSTNMIVLHNLGMLYGKLGQSNEAIKQFETIIEREPKNALAYARIGDLLFYEKKNFDEAIDYYLKVLELDPKRISSGINLAAIYSKQENYSEATSILHRCLKDNPGESDLWLNYAILMVKQKKFHEAIESYTKAIDVSPDDWKFKERASKEKAKVEAIITSKEYIEQEEEIKPAVKDKYEIGKLFIFAHDPLDDEVFEAIFDWVKGKKPEFVFVENLLFGYGSIIDQENFPQDPLSSKNFAEIIWKEQYEQDLQISKFHTQLFDLEEFGKIVIFAEEK